MKRESKKVRKTFVQTPPNSLYNDDTSDDDTIFLYPYEVIGTYRFTTEFVGPYVIPSRDKKKSEILFTHGKLRR